VRKAHRLAALKRRAWLSRLALGTTLLFLLAVGYYWRETASIVPADDPGVPSRFRANVPDLGDTSAFYNDSSTVVEAQDEVGSPQIGADAGHRRHQYQHQHHPHNHPADAPPADQAEHLSLTVFVVLATEQSLASLRPILLSLLEHALDPDHVLVTCPEGDQRAVKHVVQSFLQDTPVFASEIALVPWDARARSVVAGALAVAALQVTSSHVLLLDEAGLGQLSDDDVRVMRMRDFCADASSYPRRCWKRRAPPFLFAFAELLSRELGSLPETWEAFAIEHMPPPPPPPPPQDLDDIVPFDVAYQANASDPDAFRLISSSTPIEPYVEGAKSKASSKPSEGISIVFKTLQEMYMFSAAVSGFNKNGYAVEILVLEPALGTSYNTWVTHEDTIDQAGRTIRYQTPPASQESLVQTLGEWKNTIHFSPEIIFVSDADILSLAKNVFLSPGFLPLPTLIYIPTADLSYTDWIGLLYIEDLKRDRLP
jgi:hypothetical protein